ncbi:hypothetical protein [Nocardia sp. NPDC049149]|uniref:hypothetical protein n=1 Tax=Nocardia sp. NPDC049149 TaxID=3364315 RepID=UPI0037195244
MPRIDQDDIVTALEEDRPVEFIDATTMDNVLVPARWRPIAESGDPAERTAIARSLWNSDFVELVPNFAAALDEQLADVRVCLLREECVLVYAAAGVDEPWVVWIGWDPAAARDVTPPLWESVPGPVRTFLREVHAGYTAEDWESYGLLSPRHMRTFAAEAGFPDGIPGWDKDVAATRMLRLGKTYSGVTYWVSPDLPSDKVVVTYEGDFDIEDLAPELDNLLSYRIA